MSAQEAPRRLRAADVIDSQQAIIERLTEPRKPASSAPSFKVAQVKAVGGNVAHEWDVTVPVCDEFPTAAEAFAATLDYAGKLLAAYPPPRTNGETK